MHNVYFPRCILLKYLQISFPACSRSALGMENGEIPDSRITASSVYLNLAGYKPWMGRLNNPNSAWIPQIYRPDNWLKIDLSRKMIVTKVATQGKPNLSQWQWVTSYKISFSQDDHAWEYYKERGVEKVKGICIQSAVRTVHPDISILSMVSCRFACISPN